VIEPRVYRAAFVPALLALVLMMFSLESRPRPLAQGLPADVLFDGALAAESATRIAAGAPDRRAGRPGNRETAALVAAGLAGSGFRAQRDAFAHAGRPLENVVGRRAGRSRRQIVVIAARDSRRVPDVSASAADTAALVELARTFEGRPTRKTLVLASVDGSALGEVGAERLAGRLGERELVDAVLVMSNLGAGERRGPLILPWSNDTTRAGIGLQRTVADSIRQEIDQPVGSTGVAGQLARLAFPLGIGSQGVLLARGFDAVRISGSGELPPSDDQLDRDRLGGLGRATLRAVTAVDQGGRPARGPENYVTAVSQAMPGWVLILLSLALLLPALITSVDAFARARRRRVPVGPWMRWVAAWVGPFLAALAMAEVLALAGATPDPPPNPVAPSINPLDGPAIGVLFGVAAAGALAFFAARALARRGSPELADPGEPGAACAAALVTSVTVLLLWIVNPYTALIAVPAAHLWMLATVADPRPSRRARAVMIGLGLLPILLVVMYHLIALRMDPLTGAWYVLLLVTGHGIDLVEALIGCLLLGALGATISTSRAQPEPAAPEREDGPRVYGPGAYAGPGSLGGTESALRR